VLTGANQPDVFDAIMEEVGNLRAALARDPDPAEEGSASVEKPAE
jgi:hypothetical protein